MSIGAMGRSIVWIAIGAILVTVVLVAAQHWHGSEATTLRSYEVRPEIAHEVQSALTSALDSGNPSAPYGRVTLSPSGQLLVAAPPSIQTGVEQILKDVASHKLTATPSIHYEAWLVAGSSGTPTDAANLKEILPALHAVEQSTGATHFELLEKLSTQTQSGHDSEVQGRMAQLRVTGSLRRDDKDQPLITAALRMQLFPTPGRNVFGPPPDIRAQTELRPGELLVLGQSSLPDATDQNRSLFYIVRATL